jgi:hypothetical protein
MRLPDFLIIGAMRAGTTTLCADLVSHPDIFMPAWKEPDVLTSDTVLSPSGTKSYMHLFREARPDQRCGEASTAYTKRPDVEGVAERARRLLGSDLKLIYVVREPVARCRSQHHHEISFGDVKLPLARAVHAEPRFVDYSRYAMQLEPWLDVFPAEQFAVVRFERYVSERRRTIERLCRFLEVDDAALPPLQEEAAFNKAANRPSPSPVWRRFVHSTRWYEAYVKPRIPYTTRRWLADRLLPRAPAAADPLDPETTAFLVDALSAETARFEAVFQKLWPEVYDPENAYDPCRRYVSALAS